MGLDLQKAFSGGVPGQVQGAQQWGTVGTLIGAGGDVLKGIGGSQQYNYMAQVANLNASLLSANAGAAAAAGASEASNIKLRTGQIVGEQKAAQGADGVDVNVGSPVAVRQSTQAVGDLDANLAQWNANRSAFNDTLQAGVQKTQAGMYQRAASGALASGMLGATSTLLGGASSLASKWLQFQTAGAS